MPNSILPQDQEGPVLFNTISSFFANSKSEICFVNVMHRRKKEFRYWISSSTSCAVSSQTVLYLCSRRPFSSGNLFQRIPFTTF